MVSGTKVEVFVNIENFLSFIVRISNLIDAMAIQCMISKDELKILFICMPWLIPPRFILLYSEFNKDKGQVSVNRLV